MNCVTSHCKHTLPTWRRVLLLLSNEYARLSFTFKLLFYSRGPLMTFVTSYCVRPFAWERSEPFVNVRRTGPNCEPVHLGFAQNLEVAFDPLNRRAHHRRPDGRSTWSANAHRKGTNVLRDALLCVRHAIVNLPTFATFVTRFNKQSYNDYLQMSSHARLHCRTYLMFVKVPASFIVLRR